MKKREGRRLTCRAVYILKRGFFIVLSMLAAAKLYLDTLITIEGGGEWARVTLLPLAREMLSTTVMTIVIIVVAALVIDMAEKSDG